MRATSRIPPQAARLAAQPAALLAALLAFACSDDGDDGPPGPPGDPAPTDRDLTRHEPAPGVVLTIVTVSGASGLDGGFRVGDAVALTYRLRKLDGSPWGLAEMDFGRAHFAGPSFNYQRVLPEVDDLVARSSKNADGSLTYTFAQTIPPTYRPPYNDSPDFGAGDGELTGQALLAGTYTLGLSLGWRYTVDGRSYVDLGEASRDVLFGGAATLAPRRVTAQANCDRCHVDLRYHDGERGELAQCLMCHTSGAEDANDPALGGGTPGVSIESRVQNHKIHSAAHLPSVVGIGVDPAGDLDYDAAPSPLTFATGDGELVDFSFVDFPAWPNRTIPREKNVGYSALSAAQQAQEDRVRTGIVACSVCHGDPDGGGPLQAPEQGDLIYAQPTRRACGACHDDVDWDLPYRTNLQTMPPQPDDASCFICHDGSTAPLGVRGGHIHPLDDGFLNSGLNARILAVSESPPSDGDGAIEVGEGMAMTLALVDDTGAAVDPADLDEVRLALAGPTGNHQLLLTTAIPTALLTGAQPYTIDLPELVALEFVGRSTAALGDVFRTVRRPHLHVAGALTTVEVRTGTGAATTLVAAAGPGDNYADVADATGFARDDVLVIEDGVAGQEEYLRVQLVDGARLWFSSPETPAYKTGPLLAHPIGATVRVAPVFTAVEGVDYDLQAASGQITELVELGVGAAVLVTYSTPFVVPATYPVPLNGSPDLDQSHGEWSGKTSVAGTYSASLWARDSFTTFFAGETNDYPVSAVADGLEVQIGTAPVRSYDLIARPAACDDCHQDLQYHGGRYRGFESCLVCHGTAGAEDRPRYVAANAPATTGVDVGLRAMLHRIHMGMALDDPAGYAVVGSGTLPYPDNFTVMSWEDALFPALPGRTKNCIKCHGVSNLAWRSPGDRDHPTEQDDPVRSWRIVCLACHDSAAAAAHADSNTAPNGVESCAVCHGLGQDWNVEATHRPR